MKQVTTIFYPFFIFCWLFFTVDRQVNDIEQILQERNEGDNILLTIYSELGRGVTVADDGGDDCGRLLRFETAKRTTWT